MLTVTLRLYRIRLFINFVQKDKHCFNGGSIKASSKISAFTKSDRLSSGWLRLLVRTPTTASGIHTYIRHTGNQQQRQKNTQNFDTNLCGFVPTLCPFT